MDWVFLLLGFVIGVPVVLILGVFLVGRFLSERYEARLVIDLDRKPEDVWNALMDIEKNAVTGKMRKRLERLPDVENRPSWIEDLGSSKIIVKTIEMSPPVRLRRHLADQVVPMIAESDVVIEATPTGSRIVASSVTVIRTGTWHVPIFRIIMTLTGGGRSNIRTYWIELAKNIGTTPRFA